MERLRIYWEIRTEARRKALLRMAINDRYTRRKKEEQFSLEISVATY